MLPARDVDRWATAMRALWDDGAERARRAERALARARELFNEDALLQCADGRLRDGAAMPDVPTRDLLGVPFALTDYAGAMDVMDGMIARAIAATSARSPVHGADGRAADPELRAALRGPRRVNVPDGMPLVWGLNLLGEHLPTASTGPS